MRQIKAFIYALLGGMVAWGYWQRGSYAMTIFIALFTLAMIALTLSTIGRMRISWNKEGITLAAFPKKPKLIRWEDLDKVSLDHLGYHISASSGRFKIRKKSMPASLLKRIKDNIRRNQEAKETTHSHKPERSQ
jgi:Na+(H+)/acetate symporter ActP